MLNQNLEQIIKEYEKTLRIPEHKPSKIYFLCPVGLVGAGKSTVMKKICEKLSLLRISNDEVREIIKDPTHFNLVIKVTEYLGEKYANMGYSIGIDANSSSLFKDESFNKLVKNLNAKVIWIHINPPESFIVNKFINMHYNETGVLKDTKQALEEFERSKRNVKTNGIPFAYTFDTSRDDLDEQVDDFLKIIQKKLTNT